MLEADEVGIIWLVGVVDAEMLFGASIDDRILAIVKGELFWGVWASGELIGFVAEESGDTRDDVEDWTGELAFWAGDEEALVVEDGLLVGLLEAIEANSLMLT